MELFTSKYITDKIVRIVDVTQTAMYLVIGENKACLIDTGSGIGNLNEYVSTITDKPVFVIITHGHLDHMGSAALFNEVYMNQKDVDVFNEHSSDAFRELIFSLAPEIKNMLPMELLVPGRKEPTLALNDGDTFDLGGVSVKAIAVPGHSKGMMMVLIPEEKVMIFGDACGVSTMICDDYGTPISVYTRFPAICNALYFFKNGL